MFRAATAVVHPATGRPAARPWRRAAGLLVGALALAACTTVPSVDGEVTRFHRWHGGEPLVFTFERTPAQADSLEHRSYESLVRARLLELGFTEADPAAARYRVAFDYRATPVPYRVTEYAPAWGWGAPYGAWPGPLPVYRWRGLDPWAVMPPWPVTRETMVFRHVLRIDLFDERAPVQGERKVWEASAVALAASESFPRLMPGMVAAALSAFPGTSGASRPVDIPIAPPPR